VAPTVFVISAKTDVEKQTETRINEINFKLEKSKEVSFFIV
jgi:hypothetical protein